MFAVEPVHLSDVSSARDNGCVSVSTVPTFELGAGRILALAQAAGSCGPSNAISPIETLTSL